MARKRKLIRENPGIAMEVKLEYPNFNEQMVANEIECRLFQGKVMELENLAQPLMCKLKKLGVKLIVLDVALNSRDNLALCHDDWGRVRLLRYWDRTRSFYPLYSVPFVHTQRLFMKKYSEIRQQIERIDKEWKGGML